MRNIEILDRNTAKRILENIPIEDRIKGFSITDDLIVILRTQRFLKNPKALVDLVVELKKKFSKKIYLPFLANPYNIATLFLIGIDVFDYSGIELSSILKKRYTIYGETNTSENSEILFKKNKLVMDDVVNLIKSRRYVEIRETAEKTSDSWSKEILRYADIFHYDFYEIFYPTRVFNKNLKVQIDYIESLYRPDVVRFRKRLLERYKKPDCTKFLILLPCSAKKPYEKSKTHKKISRHLSSLKNKGIFHRVVVTSPLGLVPMELQYTYPAAHYDIPVVGYWFKEEINIIIELLEKFIKNYDGVFAYGRDIEFLKEYFDIEFHNNLRDLVVSLKNVEKDYPMVSEKERLVCNFRSLSLYQFGEVIWNGKATAKGKSLFVEGKNYLNFSTETGMLTLTENSAKYLAERGIYTVKMEDFDLIGDLFAAGIINATEDIRIGDEVAIVDSSLNLRGWGTAKMSYIDMIQKNKGLAVSVRHRVRKNSKHS